MIVGDTIASATAMAPQTTAAPRVTASTRRSSAAGFRKRLYRSCDSDVVNMNSPASAALISAENTAASPRLPTSGGTPCISTIGSASSCCGRSGNLARATMPSSGGTDA